MKTIDGSQGEGGGQIFRTALTLSMCSGKPVTIENIRAGRKKPGLLRQHLCCLNAAQEISQAEIEGAELGASKVVFKPGKIKAGRYRFSVGSAGSTTLVFQTVLPALLLAEQESTLELAGGTHNGMAPSVDFIEQSFIPQLRKMGCDIQLSLEHFGFYPAGGGAWHCLIKPWRERKRLSLLRRGSEVSKQALALCSRLPRDVGQRELTRVHRKLGWLTTELIASEVKSVGPGNLLALAINFENVQQRVEVVGEKALSAERVAGRAIKMMEDYLLSKAPVGEHLADQLMVPLVLGAGGDFIASTLSEHSRTNIKVINHILGDVIKFEVSDDHYHISTKE